MPYARFSRSLPGKCTVTTEGGVGKETCESLCGGPAPSPPPPPPRPTSFNCAIGPSGPMCEGAEKGNYTSETKCQSECHRTWLCKSGECIAVMDGTGVSPPPARRSPRLRHARTHAPTHPRTHPRTDPPTHGLMHPRTHPPTYRTPRMGFWRCRDGCLVSIYRPLCLIRRPSVPPGPSLLMCTC